MSAKTRLKVFVSVVAVCLMTMCLVAYDKRFLPAMPKFTRVVDLQTFKNPPPQHYLNISNTSTIHFDAYSKSAENGIRNHLRKLRQMFKHFEPLYQTKGVNCRAIFRRNQEEIEKAKTIAASPSRQTSVRDFWYVQATKNCTRFKESRGYITLSLGEEEDNFPIAYSLVVYKDMEMVERLLRAIYRPQNYYCLHVDASSKPAFFRAASALAECFPNVHLTKKRMDVHWGEFTVLKPELICMHELWRFRKWKYYINLTGQEFPLKTNLEIVRILKAYNGANDVQGTLKNANRERWRNTLPPHGLQPYKGSVHVAVNRDFVQHIIKDPKTQDLLKWTRKTEIPDETLFATMNHNPQLGIKGSYNGDKIETKPTFTRFKNWWERRPCAWMSVRDICILTVGDLPLLFEARHMFANKFYMWHDKVVIECLEEKNFNRTRAGVFGRNQLINTTFYANVEFVKHQVT
ncbi:beta-1,3-galactosyl-o-glycosyl-glycoprotein beta-1,6-n-acetylglucosaminyltransferase [Plakobranchus ocellatus]|uniref:Beta-1,3-galactosyl-o-glycosyl-glycoprotein beta-1,6-n-acetylglucosaminyltransferase n=1 Tax=Plakobranchus ocellatus TaxID=259542 RepID=A0AAV3YWL6_9GAST|nr:beta-1,3-galactosyl-o-glycosyl-glycoprotein beta-1,6-n-acetylglucosaminyltransferase [Plakobranchus ocellatus]